jgi:thiol-disulfide isomerase/thioredoxin
MMKGSTQMKTSTNRSALTIMVIIALTCIFACQSFAADTVPAKKIKPAAKAPAKETPAPAPAAKLGDKAAALAGLNFIKGESATLEKGKVYVVEFWATWCGPCRTSIPHLTKVQKKYKDKGVTVIGITNEKDLEKVKAFVTKQGDKMDYTVAIDAGRNVSKGYMTAYKQRGIPSAFIVNQKGNIAWVGHPMADMDSTLEQVVAGTFDLDAYAKTKAEKDAKEAIVNAKRDAENKILQKLFEDYFTAVKEGADLEKTRKIAEKFMKTDNPNALNSLAMQIISVKDVDDAKRDYETAIKAITKANTKTEGKDLRTLNTYAMVLAKSGKIKEAIKTTQKAIELSESNKRAQDYFKKQLESYKKTLAEKTAPTPKDKVKE